MSVHLAGAPVSWGVWGPHHGPADGGPQQVLAGVAQAGYGGSELGPPGYLGDPAETVEAFAAHRLRPAGAYVGVQLTAGALTHADRADVQRACALLAATARRADSDGLPGPAPVLVLADAGAPQLQTAPRDPSDRSSGLDRQQWDGAVRVLGEAQRVSAEHGLVAAVHPHLATWVESGWEVERLLETTDLPLVLDTGHLLLAGVDPVTALRDWGGRTAHVHLKDVDLATCERARATGPVPLRSWWSRSCTALGDGDVDVAGFLAQLRASWGGGWLVLERDVEPTGAPELAAMTAAQTADLRTADGLLRAP
ncbi:TIM barrel protein [Quadrisphaera oryzae]|uniref:TIM barrel protein n=1 Tax=Quadrisphaera TaxID=317661 RepID=UPI001647EE63|nr:TIM barrel protein [Quadrisphaera sp. RL12-1S]MBC3763139.1 TIM barrel protein [Quadrisphaera sp. RL12-1S]